MHKITVSELMSWNPCVGYWCDRVKSLFGDGLTPLQALELDIPGEDRLWVAYNYMARHDREGIEACILATVDRAVRSSCLICGVTDIESWAQRWLDRAEGWDDLAAAHDAMNVLTAARYARNTLDARDEELGQQIEDVRKRLIANVADTGECPTC